MAITVKIIHSATGTYFKKRSFVFEECFDTLPSRFEYEIECENAYT